MSWLANMHTKKYNFTCCSTIYHPQTDSLIESFNQMLKGMFRAQ